MSKMNLGMSLNGLKRSLKKGMRSAAALGLAVLTVAGVAQNGVITAEAATPSVVYQAHSSGKGWLGDVKDGATAGTVGESRAVECFTIEVKNIDGGIRYKGHMADKGWSDWVYDDRPCGTTGENRRLEAIMVELTGNAASQYDVEYRAHCQNVGWTAWQKSGICGTTGQSLRLEAFQVRLVKKGNGVQSTMSEALYGTSGGYITCGFDGYVNTNGRHEGIDFKKAQGAKVYSLTEGVITNVTKGSNGSSGLSTIAIYNSATNKTVIYLHTAPLSSLYVGKTVSRGEQIATEAWRGCSSSSNSHTHVEVRDGKRTAAAKSVNDYTLENSNPTSFWNSQGYTVK